VVKKIGCSNAYIVQNCFVTFHRGVVVVFNVERTMDVDRVLSFAPIFVGRRSSNHEVL
jgi:hypothetical protein